MKYNTKSIVYKRKLINWSSLNISKSIFKKILKRMKKQDTDWEKILTKHEGFISKYIQTQNSIINSIFKIQQKI